jgi:nucleoside-diphosphate-sugar epimerase
MKYIVIGANGFIGKNVCKALQQSGKKPLCLAHSDFDIEKMTMYTNYDFANAVIFDCIARIDANKDELFRINVSALKTFLEYLKLIENIQYIYFSTYATQIENLVKYNDYARSKFEAEKIIRASSINWKIVRLSFPFGKGENKNRLLPRLIEKIKAGEALVLDDTKINLTPIDVLGELLDVILDSKQKEINFTDGKTYALSVVVDDLFELLKIPGSYTLSQKKMDIACNKPFFSLSKNIKTYLKEMVESHE